jgi:hypothetical protein
MKYINCTVSGKPGPLRLIMDTGYVSLGEFDCPTRVRFPIEPGQPAWGYVIQHALTGKLWRGDTPVPDHDGANIEGPLLALSSAMPRIVVSPDKRSFQTVDGQPWVWGMVTDFKLLKKFIDGEDIAPILEQRIDVGANGVRVLGMAQGLFELNPFTTPGYYDKLAEFATFLESHGLYVEYVALADAQRFTLGQQRTHMNWVLSALHEHENVFIELANEFAKNGVDPAQFNRLPMTNLQSRGSGLSDEPPASPAWDYSTFHPRRNWKWPFTCAATINELYEYPGLKDAPIVVNEPIGAADADQEGRRSCNPVLFEKMALECKLWGAGATFHSESGLQSELWTPRQEECAAAFFRGLER